MLKEKFLFLATALVLMALTCVSARAQQPTPTPESSTEVTTGTISGQMVNERGEPMSGASVFVRALGAPNAGRSTATDAEGRFRINGLEPSLYVVTGYAPSYVSQPPPEFEGGSTNYYRIGDTLKVEMIKGGVLTGTVSGPTGEALVGIRVRALRIRDLKGQPVRTPQYASTERSTDDRGMYRIYGLAPGTYIVSAGGGSGGGPSFSLVPHETDVPTYAPSSTRDGATEYNVRGGEETNVDIRYRSEPGHTVSGTVKMSGANGANVMLLPAEGGFMPTSGAMQAPGARGFELTGVGDGDYYIMAVEFPISAASVTTIPDISVSEPKRITVKGADVGGLELMTRPPSSITGRITLEPSKAPECQGKRKPLFAETLVEIHRPEKDPDIVAPFMRMMSGGVAPDPKGAIVFRNLTPGRYRFEPRFHARFWYLQSISIGAPATTPSRTPKVDPAAGWTSLKAGEKISDLTITLAEGAASIRGRVPVAEGASIPAGTAVYLVPAEADKAGDVLRYFVTEVGSDGTFAFNSLPPGRYWSVLQNPVQPEIATLSKLRLPESAAERTKLRRAAESQKSDLELKPCQTLADYKLSFK
ncbi:MAG TPA: carboxypeptidase regulatory-like domain-containing protein [Pyrinomonadaceae bacterium]|nr:carboxypeptidase regulatory-like domain-containing protein [Pyrinomonadaceae bacterium]